MKRYITIVNRHYPPNINITGENARDLAKYLIEKHNVEVDVIHIDREYEGGGGKKEPVGNTLAIKTIYSGNAPILRHLSSFYDGYMLIRAALKKGRGPIIVMTSPPLLPMWAAWLIGAKREWILWSMDFFPEGFAASNQMNPNGWFYKWCIKTTYSKSPSKLIALGPGQAQYAEDNYGNSIDKVLLPCGVFVEQNKSPEAPDWKNEDRIYFGYCGNVSQAHSEQYLIDFIDSINPDKHRLVLALYGTKADLVRAHAINKPGIIIVKSVPRNQLGFIDVHLVSLVKSWTHVAVPSKAVSSVCSGAPIAFCGDQSSDNWQLLQEAAWFIPLENGRKEAIAKLLNDITIEEVHQKKSAASKKAADLQALIIQSYDTIASWAKS